MNCSKVRTAIGRAAIALAACLAAAPGLGLAQQPAAKPGIAPKTAGAIEPKAIEALKTMSAYLRTLKTFSVRSDTTIDEVMDTGEKVQFGGSVEYRVRAPNRLRADINSDRKQRQYFYDGKSLTIYGPRNKYYASVPASGSISELLQAADAKYGVEMPLSDLFLWGTDKSGIEDIKSAVYVGPARVAGIDTDHYAFRQQDVDWQLWIERGKTPLPRKMVITTTQEPSQPQYVAVLKWDLAPKLDDAVFRFAPPKDAKRIAIAEAAAQAAAAKK
jgi:hypothetical protein